MSNNPTINSGFKSCNVGEVEVNPAVKVTLSRSLEVWGTGLELLTLIPAFKHKICKNNRTPSFKSLSLFFVENRTTALLAAAERWRERVRASAARPLSFMFPSETFEAEGMRVGFPTSAVSRLGDWCVENREMQTFCWLWPRLIKNEPVFSIRVWDYRGTLRNVGSGGTVDVFHPCVTFGFCSGALCWGLSGYLCAADNTLTLIGLYGGPRSRDGDSLPWGPSGRSLTISPFYLNVKRESVFASSLTYLSHLAAQT